MEIDQYRPAGSQGGWKGMEDGKQQIQVPENGTGKYEKGRYYEIYPVNGGLPVVAGRRLVR
ncbi:MAG: hypothetical protein ABIF71_01995 [Planctomycetota bacterium]